MLLHACLPQTCAVVAQAVLASGEILFCTLPQSLQANLLFRGSGFFIVAHAATGSSGLPLFKTSVSQAAIAKDHDDNGWAVAYVLADDDPPDLARKGLW